VKEDGYKKFRSEIPETLLKLLLTVWEGFTIFLNYLKKGGEGQIDHYY
jgi:hypothetical protein